MNKLLAVAIAAVLILMAAPSNAERNLPKDHRRVMQCHDIEWERGAAQVRALVSCVGRVWDVPGGPAKMLSVVSCETGGTFDPRSYNPNGHVGLGQHDEDEYPGRASKWAAPLGFRVLRWQNAEVNAIVTARMAKELGTWSGQWSCA